jgi:AcrR family transcriptional regulator
MSPRLTREARKRATREQLLDAARVVFARAGYHGASVEEIASQAGYSTGALYSNFEGKEDLFLALLERVLDDQIATLQEVAHRGSIADRARGGAASFMAFVEREPQMVMLFMEFWAYAVRDPRVRPKVAARFAEVRRALTQLIVDGARDFELELVLPAAQLAIAIDALADGIARQKLADPDAVPDDLLGNSLSLLLAGATRPVREPASSA